MQKRARHKKRRQTVAKEQGNEEVKLEQGVKGQTIGPRAA